MSFLRDLIQKPKTLLAAGALGGLGLILAGCGSPGTFVVRGKSLNGDTLQVVMTCKTSSNAAGYSCAGIVSGRIEGHTFVSNSANGGMGDLTSWHPPGYPPECSTAPCASDAAVQIDGSGMYQGAPVRYQLQAFDNDPPNAGTDTASLQLYSPVNYTANISCKGCVEVKMLPGTTP